MKSFRDLKLEDLEERIRDREEYIDCASEDEEIDELILELQLAK
jgi:hypothetical protein